VSRQSRRDRREKEQNNSASKPADAPAPAQPAGPSRPWAAIGLVAVLILGAVGIFVVLPLLRDDDPELTPEPGNPVVVMETSLGTIKLELFPQKAPITVANFLKYVDDKHYDGTAFHRVVKDFVIQGGGFTPENIGVKEKATRDPIENEASNRLSNTQGTLAMARTDDPHSATAQFYVNLKDNSKALDAGMQNPFGYAVFGRVIGGMGVVQKIGRVPTNRGDVPKDVVLIKSARRAQQGS
jgi:cyclophilin family peptidyl-prolyl cis-trans isomerase